MNTLLKDIRYSFRTLLKRPAFAVIVIATLALSIGANTAIFSVVNGVLLQPLPYPNSDRLLALRDSNPTKQPDSQVAPGNFIEWQKQTKVFSALEAYRTVSYNLTGEGAPERLLAGRVSAGMFKLLGAQPIVGRDFLAEEDQPGREKVALIGEGLWQRRFGSDYSVVGKTIRLSGENFTVVGVMSIAFRLPDQRERELWTPIAFKDSEKSLHQAHYIEVIGRLKSDASVEQARADLNAIATRLAQEYPDANSGWTVKVTPLLDFVVGDAKTILWVLFSAVGLVLLIACANVMNLSLARAVTRQREMAIRAALGAGRIRIVRQLVTESVVLALIGGVIAWPLASLGLKTLLALSPPDLPRMSAASIDSRALLFTLAITLLTGIIFGLAPASELLKLDLNTSLKDTGSEPNRGALQRRIGNLLIVSEVAIALVLLIGGGLLLRTVWRLRNVDPGFDYHNALAVTLQLSEKKYSDDQRIAEFSKQLLQKTSTLPGVEAVGMARILPIIHDLPTGFYIEGRPREPDNQLPQTNYSSVSPDYFKAMGIPLRIGRPFDDRDTLKSARVAIVSESFAKQFFPGESPVGKRINVTTGPEVFREIVGVVGDVKQKGLNRETLPHTYEPFAQAPSQFMTMVVRTSIDPNSMVPAIRSEVFEIDNELPLQSVRTLDKVIANSIGQQRFASAVLAVFAAVALLLAIAGLYGVISYAVSQRTHELGIRIALGARVPDVLRLVLKQGMTFVLIGEALGLLGALVLTRLLSGLLFGITPTDALTFGAVTVLLSSVAFLACYIPARKATRVDPLTALRYE
jgi:putative ABC transport system permease protein